MSNEDNNTLERTSIKTLNLINNAQIKSLSSLADALKNMPDDVFGYHVNFQKNDFSEWISEEFNDKELANQVLDAESKENMSNFIMSRLSNSVKKTSKKQASKKKEPVKQYREIPPQTQKIELKKQIEKEKQAIEKAKEFIKQNKELPVKTQKIELKKQTKKEKLAIEKAKESIKQNKELPVKTQKMELKKQIEKEKRAIEKAKESIKQDKKLADKAQKPNSIRTDKKKIVEQPKEMQVKLTNLKEQVIIIKKKQKNMHEKKHVESVSSIIKVLEKENQILQKEREIEFREKKIQEIEERIENDIHELKSSKKEDIFFSKDFIQGIIVGILLAVLVVVIYWKFIMV
ncbi:MAG: hypothetical protein ABIC04_04150 [Nanoarchaeota archaeon]